MKLVTNATFALSVFALILFSPLASPVQITALFAAALVFVYFHLKKP